MNRHLLASLLALAGLGATGAAFADDITIDPHPFVSARSATDVQAELQQYRAAGVNPWSTSYNPLAHFKSSTTRAEVNADFLRSRGEVAAFNGEDSGSSYLAAHTPRASARVLAGELPNAQ